VRMVNILYLSHTGSAFGGGERQLIGLIKNLDRSLHNPVVICPDAGEFSARLEDLEIPVYVCHLPGWRKAISYPFRRSAVTRLVKLASKHGINLVHTSDLWLNYYAWKVGQSLKIPIVSHVRNFLKSERVHKYLFDRFDRIIAISENVKEPLILAGLPLEKIRVIYDGVELPEFSPEVERTNVLRQDYSLRRYLVGLVGRIEPFKRQREFTQVIYEVLKFRQDVTFLIVGEPVRSLSGYFREVQQAIQDYDIAEHIVFTGYRRDMPEVLGSLDLLVTLSGGSVMLEAMACEKPVISASKANPAKLRIVRHDETGFVVPYNDIHSIAKAILRLLENEEMRSEMGKAGRERVEELFDMRRMAKLTEAVYEDLL
jgi:glycosyltransferase involved in cell wall biosynthesis